jgi:chromate reductase, NAD(P)H dehydrogenase (quinone)
VSANRAALDVIADELRERGAQIDAADEIGRLPVFDPSLEPDEHSPVASWRRRLAEAEAVVFAVPEYAGGLAGGVKNATDWIVGSAELYLKPVVVVSAGTSGGEHARRQLVQSLTWQGAHVVGDLGIAAPRTKSDASGAYTHAPTVAALRALAALVLDIVAMSGDQRVALAIELVGRYGVDAAHVAPAP